jgi:hypothetical protein
MNSSMELAIIPPQEWQVMTQQADFLVKSGFLPQAVNSVPKAIAIMTLGRELGIGAWAALSSINVIQQKPTVSPQLMLALINRSGQLEDITITSDNAGCTVTMKRKGRTPHTEIFIMANATTMQLSGKDNWKKQPATMMKWRAVAACARVVFADVILGLYTPEEMGADVIADDQGNMTVIDVATEPPPTLSVVRHEPPQLAEVVTPVNPTSGATSAQPQASPAKSASSAEPSNTFDSDFPVSGSSALAPAPAPLPADEPMNTFRITEVKVVNQGNSHVYILKAKTTNITMYGGDLFRAIKIDPQGWKDNPGHWYAVKPALIVTATFDDNKWIVHTMKKETEES